MTKPRYVMTVFQERDILESPSTRKLVKEVLGLAESRDIVDAIADIEIALEILRGRFERGALPDSFNAYHEARSRETTERALRSGPNFT